MANANYRCLNPDEAGKILGVKRSQISIWIRMGVLKATNVGFGKIRPRWQLKEEDVIEFKNELAIRNSKSKPAIAVDIETKDVVVERQSEPNGTEMTYMELLEENRQLRKEIDKLKAGKQKLLDQLLELIVNNE